MSGDNHDIQKCIVLGGAGYIGSHMLKYLVEKGLEVVCIDNLSTGHRDAVPPQVEFHEADILDRTALDSIINEHQDADLAMHFCAKSLVGESVTKPDLYYENNVTGTLNLLQALKSASCRHLIFSSTAAVFGRPNYSPIDEKHPKNPINPYGRSKLMIEQVLEDYASAFGIHSVSLRYFNAAGADASGMLGERHEPETHLIPNILKSLLHEQAQLKVFGDNYDTPDGTCVRDYIHVTDLCEAHWLAAQYLLNHPGAHQFNLGNGQGFSILEVIQAAESVTGQSIPYAIEPPRAGDPPELVADSQLARQELGWSPRHSDLLHILQTAWNFHRQFG